MGNGQDKKNLLTQVASDELWVFNPPKSPSPLGLI
ncbi:MAG: hypothetical protein RLZZ338_1276, partial [Cyanobacteriota bacterium]